MVAKFDNQIAPKEYNWKLLDILPKVLPAGENAGVLTPEGSKKLDVSGHLKAGIPVCPPEGYEDFFFFVEWHIAMHHGADTDGCQVFDFYAI